MVQLLNNKSLFNLVELEVTEIGKYPNGIEDIYQRKIDGAIIHNVFSPLELSGVVAQLRGDKPPIQGRLLHNAYVFGQALIVSPPDLKEYFAAAKDFRRSCSQLFNGARDFETRVRDILTAMSGGRSVEVPPAPQDGTYTPATIRALEDGQYIPPHCGNQFLHGLPQYWHLSRIVELENQLSCFAVLNSPQEGGELVLYDLEWGDTKNGRVKSGQTVDSVIESYNQMPISLNAGDMILFDGGRIWHRVNPVKGDTPRITIGGFAAFSEDRKKIYYWS